MNGMKAKREATSLFDWPRIAPNLGGLRSGPAIDTFTHIQLYHLCRPKNVQTYYEKGLLAVSFDESADAFRAIFSDYPCEELANSIEAVRRPTEPKRADAALDDRFLLESARHYGEYGSEVLQAFANRLPPRNGTVPKDRLANVGDPVFVILNVPIDFIEPGDYDGFVNMFELIRAGDIRDLDQPGNTIDFTMSFHAGLPPEFVVCHKPARCHFGRGQL